MTWTKLGDEFSDAARDLSSDAFRTHVEALCWSNRRLLDLAIPKRDLRRFAEAPEPEAAAAELEAAGWWEDLGEDWWIGCRFADWQVERSVIEHRRNLSAETSRRHRLHRAGDHRLCEPARCTALRDTPGDTSRDLSRQVSPGTGRDGTGRAGNSSAPIPPRSEDAREEPEQPEQEATADASPPDVPLCGWCKDTPARIERTGQPFAYEGKPWCGWCEPVTPDASASPAPTGGKRGAA